MANIPLPVIHWGKRKERSQMCEIFTDDGRIVIDEMAVIKSCVDDDTREEGFLLDSDDQFLGEDNHWYQILYEKSALPVCMIGNKVAQEANLTSVLNQLFLESQESAKEEQYRLAGKNVWWDRIVVIVSIASVTALIFGFMAWKS